MSVELRYLLDDLMVCLLLKESTSTILSSACFRQLWSLIFLSLAVQALQSVKGQALLSQRTYTGSMVVRNLSPKCEPKSAMRKLTQRNGIWISTRRSCDGKAMSRQATMLVFSILQSIEFSLKSLCRVFSHSTSHPRVRTTRAQSLSISWSQGLSLPALGFPRALLWLLPVPWPSLL